MYGFFGSHPTLLLLELSINFLIALFCSSSSCWFVVSNHYTTLTISCHFLASLMASIVTNITISKDDVPLDFLYDPLNPYYLHHNESPYIVSVNFKLISGVNYDVWQADIFDAFYVKTKIDFIDDLIPRLFENKTRLYSIWKQNNDLIKAWLHNSMSTLISTCFRHTEFTSNIWEELKTQFYKTNETQIYQLWK